MTSNRVNVRDPNTNRRMLLYVQGFRAGLITHNTPTVVLGVGYEDGSLAGTFEVTPKEAHELSEFIRQAAEYANKQDEEK
jgi:hypothetical protein